jgi:hypothetical protein
MVDFVKAFDMVQRPLLWERMQTVGIHGILLNTVQSLYKHVSMRVKLNGRVSNAFESMLGVKQGDPLSPVLFGLFIEALPEFYQALVNEHEDCDLLASCPDLEGLALFYLLFADDLVLMSMDAAKLQRMLNHLEHFCQLLCMEVNISKTEVLVFGTPMQVKAIFDASTPLAFEYACQPLRLVTKAKYLGMWFTSDGKLDCMVTTVADAARRACFLLHGVLNRLQHATPAIHLQLFNSLVRPILSYGSEVWGVYQLKLPRGIRDIGRNWYHPESVPEKVQINFVRHALGLGHKSVIWIAMHDAGMPYMQEHWLKGALRFWNAMHASSNDIIVAGCKSDLKLMIDDRIEACWSWKLCHFVADLGSRMEAPVFAEPYQAALLHGAAFPPDAFDYFWALDFQPDGVCDLLSNFWLTRVCNIVGDNPREHHCRHAALTEYVHNVGVPLAKKGFPAHLRIPVDRETTVRYMRFRHNTWRLASVLGAWTTATDSSEGTHACKNCKHCGAEVEDRVHLIFECPYYEELRAQHQALYPDRYRASHNLAAWMNDQDQVAIARCISDFYTARFE